MSGFVTKKRRGVKFEKGTNQSFTSVSQIVSFFFLSGINRVFFVAFGKNYPQH